MSASHLSGPFNAYGQLASGTGGSNPEAGPSVFYQGTGFPDPRQPYAPGVTGVGKLYGFQNSPNVVLLDMIPATLTTTKIAAAAAVTTGVAMTLVSAFAYGIQPAMQIVPFGSVRQVANQVSGLLGLDLGFGSGSITAAAKAVSSYLDFRLGGTDNLTVGQPIFIGGAGAGGKPLFTTVASITSSTAFTVADAATTTVTAQPIGAADANLVTPEPFISYGAARMFEPAMACARSVSITATNAGATGGAFTVVGYDIYGVRMTETLTHAGGATTISGVKCFKYILSVTPAFTDAQTYSVGTLDTYGFALRADLFESSMIHMNAALITASTGYTAPVLTDPATATTGDVRGKYAVQTAANGSAVGTGRRLRLAYQLQPYQIGDANPTTYKSLFGVSQA